MALQKSMDTKIELYPEQQEALERLFSGAVLLADTGAGKTYTALSFYLTKYKNKKLYIITVAKKRDEGDWEYEASNLGITDITVDSWNNIKKYKDIEDAFFIFDEQRVVGYSTWSKNFIKIAKKNKWIMLTATPGDTWMDYIPLFIANGFYRNKTDFVNQHVEWNPWVKFPQVKAYHNEGKLISLRKRLLVTMIVPRRTTRDRIYTPAKINFNKYSIILKNRWNIYTDSPIKNGSELLYTLRRAINSSEDRQRIARFIISVHSRLIVYYNFNYELDILKNICEELGREYYQHNGHIHEAIPDTGDWIYLVQYTSGAEAWNCTTTDSMLFYSLNYSYRTARQCEGRIDRVNTPFTKLQYYYIHTPKTVDDDILKAIQNKGKFNVRAWLSKEKFI